MFVMLFLFSRITDSNLLIEMDYLSLLILWEDKKASEDPGRKTKNGRPDKRTKL